MVSKFSKFVWIIRSLARGSFAKNPKARPLSIDQQRALAVGLILNEQNGAYTNSLASGNPKNILLESMKDWWNINDKESAYEVIEFLRNEGHRKYFSGIFRVINMDETNRNRELELEFGDDAEIAIEYADNLLECVSNRGENNIVAFNEENMKKGILAWDIGRLTAVTRYCFDMGFLDEITAWDIINDAYEMVIKEYETWKDFSVAYLIGKGMWGGDDYWLDNSYNIVEDAFEKNKSPWKNIPLK